MPRTRTPAQERKYLVKKADELFSKIIRARDGVCIVCGTTEKLSNGHLHSRIAHSTRWDPENCWAQCWSCNSRHEYDFYPMAEAVKKKLGQEKYDALHLRYRTPVKISTPELAEMVERFKQELKEME